MVNKEGLRRSLEDCAEHHSFVFSRGDRVRNLADLANAVESLQEHEFRSHVSQDGDRHHVAAWVRDVFENAYLAHDLTYGNNVESKEELARTIRDHLEWLRN